MTGKVFLSVFILALQPHLSATVWPENKWPTASPYAHSSMIYDVYGFIHFYMLDGLKRDSLGRLERDDNLDLYRADADFRMERYQNILHLASGKPDKDGRVYYMKAAIDTNMVENLSEDNVLGHWEGSGRKGQPDLKIVLAPIMLAKFKEVNNSCPLPHQWS